jgi:hypothetical protein
MEQSAPSTKQEQNPSLIQERSVSNVNVTNSDTSVHSKKPSKAEVFDGFLQPNFNPYLVESMQFDKSLPAITSYKVSDIPQYSEKKSKVLNGIEITTCDGIEIDLTKNRGFDSDWKSTSHQLDMRKTWKPNVSMTSVGKHFSAQHLKIIQDFAEFEFAGT